MPSGVSRFTVGALGTCTALAVVEGAAELGVPVPRTGIVALGTAAAVLAATVAVRNLAYVRRGPLILAFQRREGMLCDARESAAIRAAAQLRGTMGGAGHLSPHRLALSAAAWAAAALQALMFVVPEHGPTTFLPLAWVVASGGLAVRFPAVPFYYREAAGGCVVAFPADVCARLLERARLAPAPSAMQIDALGTGADLGDGAQPAPGVPAEARRDEPPT